jgi:hypothetical protein
LSPLAARVLGCLLEKEFATPDLYPLTLNALTNACNQRSNRDPIMSLCDSEVMAGMDELRAQRLGVLFSGADSRVPKYKHKFEQVFSVETAQRAVLCELLVRGPQTSASLRSNAQRLHRMPEALEFEALLEALVSNPTGALVRKMARQPGQKEARWTQLVAGEPVVQAEQEIVYKPAPQVSLTDLERRVAELEGMVGLLISEVATLTQSKELGGRGDKGLGSLDANSRVSPE